MSVRDVKKSFGPVQAVRGVDLTVNQGEVVALLGPNGAGKTTLIDVALGLTEPSAGHCQLFGMTAREAIRRALVGVVNQTGALPPEAKVGGTLGLFASLYETTINKATLLDITNLNGLEKRKIGKLSGGERQRVRLALALQHDPLLLILDEPTTGMDASARMEFWEVMGEEVKRGRTIIFATHYLAEAEAHADRAVIMKDGVVIADGTPGELKRGRVTLKAQVPAEAWSELEAGIRSVDPTVKAAWSGGMLTAKGTDLDALARHILADDRVHGLRITESSLEEAFSVLVKEQS